MPEHSKDQRLNRNDVRQKLALADLNQIFDITTGLLKWLSTTILVLNGAALIALIGSADFRFAITGGPGWLFLAGIILALFANMAIIKGMTSVGEALFKAIWSGDRFDCDEYDDFAPSANSSVFAVVGAVLLGLAIVSFAGGCVWIGVMAASQAREDVKNPVNGVATPTLSSVRSVP